jgi:glucosinolate gamma-glutamyl hydrolase
MGSFIDLKIAILINHPSNGALSSELRQTFLSSFLAVSPHASITFFDPIHLNTYPDPSQFDLIILSGGKGNPLLNDEWILSEMKWVQDLVREFPRKKVLGICWGHQLRGRLVGWLGTFLVVLWYASLFDDGLILLTGL